MKKNIEQFDYIWYVVGSVIYYSIVILEII